MSNAYIIFGRKVESYQLVAGTLATLFGTLMIATGGKQEKPSFPPINAGSKEEEKFILDFIKNKEASAEKH
ncbi:hypothetical protein NADFUDRAFT_48536 [Nadsonia fulvescens var. elongata DSM 6958]|uniref:ATP synthase subunit K, mitochondrial n=1 Tax=Nadsonia fulvescens var. elongata DSM 6958 TaxID=857566 RepID=A0A1E3PRJ4_9ASCO|nr:hypothetical protein NADFUDRAFT_48536 [Nadsonia fulvescens var. elongata DSM 6958]